MESGSVLTCFDGAMGFQNISVQWAQILCNYTKDDWNTLNYTRLWNCMANMSYSQFLPLDAVSYLERIFFRFSKLNVHPKNIYYFSEYYFTKLKYNVNVILVFYLLLYLVSDIRLANGPRQLLPPRCS